MQKILISLVILCTLVFSALATSRVVLEHTTRRSIPNGWEMVQDSAVDVVDVVRLTIAIKQSNVDRLIETLYAVSDPFKDSYGHYLTFEQVNDLVRPSDEALAAVESWIFSNVGKDYLAEFDYTLAKDFLVVAMPIEHAERLLQTKFFSFHHEEKNVDVIRALDPYSVPSEVALHLDFVGGVHRFPSFRNSNLRSKSNLGASPDSLRKLYNVTDARGGKAPANSQAVAAFLKQYYHPFDLSEFFRLFYTPNIGDKVAREIGPNSGLAGVEASLDIEYIMALGSGVPTWFWSVGGLYQNQEPFLDWITAIGNTTDAPYIHSVSYGDDEDSLSADYMIRINNEFAKTGSRGISIMFASGDSGVGGDFNNCKQFVPNFPVSSPFVTGVGGTLDGRAGHEEVNSLSGGGFSNIFARPSYQDSAVQHYLSTAANLPPPSFYNQTGRGYPDVAALSEGFTVVSNGIPIPGVAGTSCAAPTFSGIMSLLNDVLLSNNLPPLGFLNPLIYSVLSNHTGALFDVHAGCNPGCGQDGFCAQYGWDPSSGYGTPNYAILKDVVLKTMRAKHPMK